MENVPKVLDNKPGLLITADALFKSGLFPNVKNVYGAFSIIQYASELGIGPMTGLQTMAIVSGKICMGAQAMLALAIKAGVTYQIVRSTNDIAEIKFKGDTEYTSIFGLEDAKKAGIYREQSGWTKYPKDMCFWRCVTQGIRRVKPGVALGLYAIEEIQDAPALDTPVQDDEKPQDAPQGTISPDPLSDPSPKSTNFEWLKRMGQAKKAIGDEAYYIILARHGFAHSNEILDSDMEDEILNELREAYKHGKK